MGGGKQQKAKHPKTKGDAFRYKKHAEHRQDQKNFLHHIIVRTKDCCKLQDKSQVSYMGKPIRTTDDFSMET